MFKVIDQVWWKVLQEKFSYSNTDLAHTNIFKRRMAKFSVSELIWPISFFALNLAHFLRKGRFWVKLPCGQCLYSIKSYLENIQLVKLEKSKCSKYAHFSWLRKMLKFSGMSSHNIIFYELEKYEVSAFESCIWNFLAIIFHDFIV